MHRRAPWLTGVVVALSCARPGPQSVAFNPEVHPAHAQRVTRGASPQCAAKVGAELVAGGARLDVRDDCSGVRSRARSRLGWAHRRARFGTVDSQRVDLGRLSLFLGEAVGCPRWPLRQPGALVLRGGEARQAGCAVAVYDGPIVIDGLGPNGDRHVGILVLEARRGVFELDFGEVDHRLREAGLEGLAAFDSLELGTGAWAGTVNLSRLREFLAQWHLEWVRRGRGSPGLYLHAHPSAQEAPVGEALAVEARLSREERDYLSVARGEMSAQTFLERHLWSPYRKSVRGFDEPALGSD